MEVNDMLDEFDPQCGADSEITSEYGNYQVRAESATGSWVVKEMRWEHREKVVVLELVEPG